MNNFKAIIYYNPKIHTPSQPQFKRQDSIVEYKPAKYDINYLYVYFSYGKTLLANGFIVDFYSNPNDGSKTQLGTLINQIKYKIGCPTKQEIEYLSGIFIEALNRVIKSANKNDIIITPILSSKKISNELADKLANKFGLTYANCIYKNDNLPQSKSTNSFSDGLVNSRAKYDFDNDFIVSHKNQIFIIVDDIFGSGASLAVILQKFYELTGHKNNFFCIAKDIGR